MIQDTYPSKMACYCGYLEPAPRHHTDTLCDECEHLKALAKQKYDKMMKDVVEIQLSLPDGHPDRIFSDEDIRATDTVFGDKNGKNRDLLQEIRKRLE